MAANSAEPFKIPSEVSDFAEKSVDQARKALEALMSVAHRTVSTFEGQAETARKTVKDAGDQALAFAERNIASSFDLAARLVRAKNVNEVLQLQCEHIRTQMDVLAERATELGAQAKNLGEQATKMAKDASGARSAA